MTRLGKNILAVIGCAAFALTVEPARSGALAFLAGLAFASIGEYVYHRFVLHGKTAHPLRRHHIAHHRAFAGGRQIDRDDPRIENLVEHPLVFPAWFAIIFVALSLFGVVTREFLLALTLHYVLFEAAHWGTHVRNNPMDRFIARIPILGPARRRMVEHHLSHHRRPDAYFSVLPPYAPDLFFGTKSG